MKGTGKQLVGVKKFLWAHTSRALWATEIFQEIKSQLKRNINNHDKGGSIIKWTASVKIKNICQY